MAGTDRHDVVLLALENALAILVRKLDEKGVLDRSEYTAALHARGTSVAMESALDFTQQVGREMAEIAKRIG